MKTRTSSWAKVVGLCAVATVVASCGLIPRAGPSKNEIFAGSVSQGGDAFVIVVDDRVNREASVSPALGFTQDFTRASSLGSDTIRAGDTLGLTIWENVEDGLLVATGQNATVLEEIQVDGRGFVFVPYVGRVKASGNTPEGLRRIITNRLQDQTPDPQVQVRRVAGDGSTVTVIGSVGGQGVYPIERPTRTLTAMLANAGGVAIQPDIARVTVIRGNRRNEIWFQDLFKDPGLDIALRGGDKILVEEDSRSFTVLGATGGQSLVEFESQTLSAIEAIAQVGGLNSTVSDPTGVFVLRNEPETIARNVVGRPNLSGTQRLIYVLDLTRPNGMFNARDFSIRDDDTVYVTEAPIVTWDRTIQALTGSLANFNALGSTLGVQ
ncbi:MAG: polysaccharide biosynthesis/export family protein [Pseudomonadota bacterium]